MDPRSEVNLMLQRRQSFRRIQGRIDSLSISEDAKAALWLLAWSDPRARRRERVARQAEAGGSVLG